MKHPNEFQSPTGARVLHRSALRSIAAKLRFLSPAMAITVAAAVLAFACDEHDHSASAPQEGAHVHGIAGLDIAVDGTDALLQLRAPAASIYGFEHDPRNDDERAVREQALDRLRNPTAAWLKLPEDCTAKTVEVGLHYEGDGHSHGEPGHSHGHEEEGHRDLHGEWKLTCKKKLSGRTLELNFGESFDHLETLHVQVLSEEREESKALQRGVGQVEL